jgi:hypothetical protein
MTKTPIAAIVLAAGLGTRMKSARPKAMHEVGGRPVIGHIAAELARLGVAKAVLVIGPGMDALVAAAQEGGAKRRVRRRDPDRSARYGARRPPGARRVGGVRRRRAGRFGRRAFRFGRDLRQAAGGTRRGTQARARRAGRARAGPQLLRPPGRVARRRACEDRRSQGMRARGSEDRLRQFGRDGVRRRGVLRSARQDRQRQRQGRVLPDRRRRDRAQAAAAPRARSKARATSGARPTTRSSSPSSKPGSRPRSARRRCARA